MLLVIIINKHYFIIITMVLKVKNYVRIIAGLFVFITALLGYLININWLFVTMLVGINLFQFGFTNWCPLAYLLKKLGVKE